jgi:hypothetical protein
MANEVITAETMVAQFKAQIETNNQIAAAVNPEEDSFVVVCEGIAIGFEFEGVRAVKSFTCGGAAKAPRFNAYNAKMLASSVRNGRGTRALAMYVKDAIDAENRQLRECIATFSK